MLIIYTVTSQKLPQLSIIDAIVWLFWACLCRVSDDITEP